MSGDSIRVAGSSPAPPGNRLVQAFVIGSLFIAVFAAFQSWYTTKLQKSLKAQAIGDPRKIKQLPATLNHRGHEYLLLITQDKTIHNPVHDEACALCRQERDTLFQLLLTAIESTRNNEKTTIKTNGSMPLQSGEDSSGVNSRPSAPSSLKATGTD